MERKFGEMRWIVGRGDTIGERERERERAMLEGRGEWVYGA